MDMPTGPKKTRIVVVGGGAGGLELVAKLGRALGKAAFDILLVDKAQAHIWKPLLHEVAAGSLDANLDEVGYRGHAHRWNYRFFDGALEDIDRDAREIIIAPIVEEGREVIGRHRIGYDWLVLAIGSVSNDFSTPGVREHCIFLDERAEADRFRRKLLNQCLRVSRQIQAALAVNPDEPNPAADAVVNIVIIGGGATGVELAAELHMSADSLAMYGLEVFDSKRLRTVLVEAGPRILPALPEKLAAAARHELEAIGVRVCTDEMVTTATADGIQTKRGDVIAADLMVWAAGVKGAPFMAGIGGLETTRGNQVVVGPTLQTTRDDRIFAMGDCASYTPPGASRPVPPRAQTAHQMADIVFHNIRAGVAGKPMKPFIYQDHGSLVSLARYATVGSLMGNLVGGKMAVEGRLARFVYMSLYRMHLIAIHGWLRGLFLIGIGHVNAIVRPKLKLH